MIFILKFIWKNKQTNKQNSGVDFYTCLTMEIETRRQRHEISTGIRDVSVVQSKFVPEQKISSGNVGHSRKSYRLLGGSVSHFWQIYGRHTGRFRTLRQTPIGLPQSSANVLQRVQLSQTQRSLGRTWVPLLGQICRSWIDLHSTYTERRDVLGLSMSSSTMENYSSKRLASIANVMWNSSSIGNESRTSSNLLVYTTR